NVTPGTGTVSGTVTRSGYYRFILRATDSAVVPGPATADHLVIAQIQANTNSLIPRINTLRVPDGTNGAAYPATQLRGSVESGHASSWAFTSPTPGFTLSTSGVLSSLALPAAGTYYFFVTLTDTTSPQSTDG